MVRTLMYMQSLFSEGKMSRRALGIMSGTSMDGVDLALLDTDGESIHEFGASLSVPFADDLRRDLAGALTTPLQALMVERDYTLAVADAVKGFMASKRIRRDEIDVIGFHGQTVLHRPKDGVTWQLGDPSLLAERTGLPVVADFRRRDMAAGGQGAPLVPLYHEALALKTALKLPVAVVNIGGVANLTYLGEDGTILAFDTGAGNALLDDWMLERTGSAYDEGGQVALTGQAHEVLVQTFLSHPYLDLMPPKSLDRNDFTLGVLYAYGGDLSTQDGAATLAEVTARAIAEARRHLPDVPRQWLICGGGRHNEAIMQRLSAHLPGVTPVETVGWRGDVLEAEAFAYLAVRAVRGLPLSLPETTGAIRPVTGGAFYSR